MEALWDTGAQASIINAEWRKQHLPNTIIRPIEDLLGPGTLTGLAANHTEIPFEGWVEVTFRLFGDSYTEGALQVPMLMTGDPNVAENPIIGFNVIEEVVNRREKQRHKPNTTHMVSQAFSISITAAKSILKLLKTAVLFECWDKSANRECNSKQGM